MGIEGKVSKGSSPNKFGALIDEGTFQPRTFGENSLFNWHSLAVIYYSLITSKKCLTLIGFTVRSSSDSVFDPARIGRSR